jgi:hypothetical protein
MDRPVPAKARRNDRRRRRVGYDQETDNGEMNARELKLRKTLGI